MAPSILITGASGVVGTEVARQLDSSGIRFKAAVHSPGKPQKWQLQNAELVEFDFAKPDTIRRALEGIQKLFLLSPVSQDAGDFVANAIQIAKESGAKYVVRISAIGAHLENPPTISRLHREMEKMIERSGLAYTHLRPHTFMQNYAHFIAPQIRNQNAFYGLWGDAKVSHIDVRDIASVAVKALTEDGHAGKAYELTGGEGLTNDEVAQIFSETVGRKITHIPVTAEQGAAGMRQAGYPDWIVEALIELYNLFRTGDYARISPSVRDLTGNDPIRFTQFARDYASAFK